MKKRLKTSGNSQKSQNTQHFGFTMFSVFRMIVTAREHGGMLQNPIKTRVPCSRRFAPQKELEVLWPQQE
jgi:hypothetical protein